MFRLAEAICVVGAVLVFASSASSAYAGAPAIAGLNYSADIGANLVDTRTFVARRDYVSDNLSGTRVRKQIAGLPDTLILRDFHVEPNGDVLFCLDGGVLLGDTHFAPADVIRYDGAAFTKEFDSAAAGVAASVHCDGVARWGDTGTLLLSFDRTFAIGGITIRPADVIAFSNGSFGPKVLDAQAIAIPAGLNVDAIDTFRTKRYLLVSFDAGGSIGGVAFTSADIMQLDRVTGVWSKRYAMSVFSDRWQTANLDGLAAVNVDTIFEDEFQ